MHFFLSFAFSALLLSVLATPITQPPTSGGIPLVRDTGGLDPRSVAEIQNADQNNTHPFAFAGGILDKRDANGVPLNYYSTIGFLYSRYYGLIGVGSPPIQYFNVAIATGSTDLLLPLSSCDNCEGHKQYDPIISITSVEIEDRKFQQHFPNRETMSGKVYSDHIIFAGMTAFWHVFGAATHYPLVYSADRFPPAGILGLGYQALSIFQTPSVVTNIYNTGRLTEHMFGVRLAGPNPEVYIGGVNSALYTGEFAVVNVRGHEWMAFFQGISALVNGRKEILVSKKLGRFFVGTRAVIGDVNGIRRMCKKIPGCVQTSHYSPLFMPCGSKFEFIFEVANKEIIVSDDALNEGPVPHGAPEGAGCLLGAYAVPPNHGQESRDQQWILGDNFLKNVYTKFDYGRKEIGFADLAPPIVKL